MASYTHGHHESESGGVENDGWYLVPHGEILCRA
jgi:hypothetical protein